MFKFLIFVIVLVVPIFGEVNEAAEKNLDNESEKKPAFEVDEKKIAKEAAWREKCKNVSGVDVDVDIQLRLYENLLKCRNSKIDTVQLQREIDFFLVNFTSGYDSNVTISDLQALNMSQTFQRYCVKYPDYINCRDWLIPIYVECFTRREVDGFRVRDEVPYRIVGFFCDSDGLNVYKFVTAKIIDCTFAYKSEFLACYDKFKKIMAKNYEKSLINLYKPENVCNAVEALKACALPIYEQCTMSPTAGELLNALFKYINTEHFCADHLS